MQDIECPYCNEWQEINHDDGYGYEESTMHEQECGSCSKTFGFETSISFYYEPHKLECKNDGEHKWEPTKTYPKCFTRMVCGHCWEEREPSQEEKVEYEIPSIEEEDWK